MKNESGSPAAVVNFSWGLVPLFVLAHCTHHILTALPTPFLPMIRDDFHLNYTQSGLLLSAFSLSYGLGQLPAGWLADRIGQVLLITMGSAAWLWPACWSGFPKPIPWRLSS